MLLIVTILSCIPVSAESETKREIIIRTGPGMTYDEECTLPADTKLKALEYERKGETIWHMVEFTLGGELYRGYVSDSSEITLDKAAGYEGKYAHIEFQRDGTLCRGYISSGNRQELIINTVPWEEEIDFSFDYDLMPVPAHAEQDLPLQSGPGSS